jgi:sulfite exporter TauE/SafE
MSAVAAGLLLGILGSGHCALMCGPLASLRVARHSRAGYHGGRMLTYLALGTAAAALGAGATATGIGAVLSIAAGLLLLGMAASRTSRRRHFSSVTAFVTSTLGRLALKTSRHPRLSSWIFGAANALLPCGLVYAAVIGAAGFGSARDAWLFLAAFGAGTVPALMLAGVAGPALLRVLPISARLATTVALALVGVLLVARGLANPHIHAAQTSSTPAHAHGGLTAPETDRDTARPQP